MSEWPTIELGQLAEFRNGLNYTAADNGAGLAVVGVSDFQDKSLVDFSELAELDPSALSTSDALIQRNDILFVRSNGNRELIGRSLLVLNDPPKLTSHSGFTIRLRFSDERADPRFFAYFLRGGTIRRHLSSQGGGTNINNLNQGILSRLTVPLPPLDTQRRIASILAAYDELIEVNRRRVAVLEGMARGLFETMVTRLAGELPPPSGGSGNSRPPSGWEISELGDVADFIMGQSPPSEELNRARNGFPFHQGVTDFGALFPGRRVYCTPSNSKKLAAAGDILFSVRAPVGRINIATEEVVLGRGVSSIRSKIGTQRFLAAHLRATFHKPDLIGNGAIYKAVGRQDMRKVPVILPPTEVRDQIDGQIGPLYDLLWTIEQSNTALAAARDHLLPRLISGQLSVAAAERELEEAA